MQRREGLSRRVAAHAAVVGVRAALEDEGDEVAKELLKPNGVLRGQLTLSRFDAVVQNGDPVLAAHGLSFQVKDADHLEKDVNAISFSLNDVRQRYPEVPLALVALPPRWDVSGEFERAREICAALNVDVLNPEGVEAWARPVVHDYLS